MGFNMRFKTKRRKRKLLEEVLEPSQPFFHHLHEGGKRTLRKRTKNKRLKR